MKLDDLLNSDDYKRGFEEGKTDALAGKNKHNLKVGLKAGASAKFWIHGPNAIDTFYKGYNAGYEIVLKSKTFNEVSHAQETNIKTINDNNINFNSSNMAKGQHSFAFQIELAEDLKSYLHGFQERLVAIADNYKRKYENLGNVMMEEYHDDFSENFENTIKIISDLVDQINDNDIPHVERYIDFLESRP